jgi:nucleoside-diphosphate-sugar epimerase
LRDWSYEQNRVAILLRLANVIGPGCRGLIPYLVRHAKNDPEGLMLAQLRGHGRLVRDYVPVSFVVEIIRIVLERSWTPGNAYIFNVSTGRGLTNRQVAEVVQRVLRREGYRLRCNWDNPVPPGEARSVIENTRGLKEVLGAKIPSRNEVEECIRVSVLDHLRSGRA